MKPIAYIYTDMKEKFGIPRQSGLVKGLTGTIVFEPEYRTMDAVRGLENFDYLWLLWEFEGVDRKKFHATVRPPRLGGNMHMGVFATRSPFRPNPIGLSSVKLCGVEETPNGPVIYVSGVDMRNKTPIYDIKPYLPYADAHPDAGNGFAEEKRTDRLRVVFPEELLKQIPKEKQMTLVELLEQDPRPSYHTDENREYGLSYADYNVVFTVSREEILTVTGVFRQADIEEGRTK